MKTAPFDLEKALAGHPLVTRGGKRVNDFTICEEGGITYPFRATVQDKGVRTFTPKGSYIWYDSDEDLLLLLPDEDEAAPTKPPPLGIIPRRLHEEKRAFALLDAIERASLGLVIPTPEWVQEARELFCGLLGLEHPPGKEVGE